MAQIPFQHGEQYVYTNGPMGPEYVTFVYPGINHYNFMDADGRTIRLQPFRGRVLYPTHSINPKQNERNRANHPGHDRGARSRR